MLLLQRCAACGEFRYPPRPLCPKCGSFDVEWVQSSGRGFVYSWVVPYHPVHPAVVNLVPYNVVLVELDEGPRVASNLLETAPNEIRAGQRVEVVFEGIGDGITLFRFRKAL
jgi:uncharacterized OB-fold protein